MDSFILFWKMKGLFCACSESHFDGLSAAGISQSNKKNQSCDNSGQSQRTQTTLGCK